jgi:hypothetical protein
MFGVDDCSTCTAQASSRRPQKFMAVSWRPTRGWVDLEDREVGSEWRLSAWTPD